MSRHSKLHLTARQLEIVRYVAAFRRASGCAPTQAEVARAFGVAQQTIHSHTQALVRRGALEAPTGLHRGMALTKAASDLVDDLDQQGAA